MLVARQRTREAAQPRQQRDDAFTDFLRRISHAFMLDNTSGEVIFFRAYPEHSFSLAWLSLPASRAVAACSCRRCSRAGAAGARADCRTPRARSAPRCATLTGARALRAERLLSEHRAELDRDPRGDLVVRAEVVAIDITEAALARAPEGAIRGAAHAGARGSRREDHRAADTGRHERAAADSNACASSIPKARTTTTTCISIAATEVADAAPPSGD